LPLLKQKAARVSPYGLLDLINILKAGFSDNLPFAEFQDSNLKK
jgi:hypothetical protein